MLTTARRMLARAVVLLLALSGSGAFVAFAATPAEAAITDPFVKVFDQSITGGIQIRGNTVLSCQDTATSCATARANSARNNNDFFMTYVDVDGDGATFDSSSSTVDVPAGGSVLFAALTWGGKTTAGGSLADAQFGTGTAAASPTPANAGQVQLKVPGSSSYATVASTRTSFLSGTTGSYQGYADVTSAVQAAGNGSYTVADVQTATGTNIHGGWALTIAYSNPTDPPRNLTIFSGFGSVAAGNVVDFTVSGFQTPPSGLVKTTLGVVSYEGDAGSTGDQMQLGNTVATLANVTDALHPVANSLISVISDNGVDSSARTPRYLNQLGFDAATFNVDGRLANNSTSAAIRLTSAASTGETYFPGVVTFATDLYTPTLVATKSVAVVKASGNTQSGVVEPGDTLRYTVDATNTDGDDSVSTVLSDTMPTGTTYTPGSLTSGGTALTDAAGDDIGSYNGATRRITVNAGTGATSAAGGRVNVGASIATVTFEVVVDSGIADGASIPNTASLAYAGDLTGVAVTAASNAVTSAVVLHHSDLAITKTADLTRVQKGSSTPVTYTLAVTNTGPYADPAVTVTDTLPAGAVVVSATPSSGSCTTPAGTVVCDLGALANGGTKTVAVRVTLDATSDPAVDTATVAGTNVDSSQAGNSASLSTVVNTAPVALADSGTTSSGTTTVTVLANDSDTDGDTLSVTPGTTTPTKGSIVVNADRTITYTATAGAAGTDTFSYVASDGRGGSSSATVTVTIPNASPVATADAASTTPGDAVTVGVLANDTDPNIPVSSQSLSVSAVTQPAGGAGAVTTNGATVTFTPSGSFLEGTATFTYTVSDGAGGTDTETVTVTIPNVGPVAADDSATTPYVSPVTVDVLANDSDDNGDPLTVTTVTGASHGTAVVTGTGTGTRVVYTPTSGWSGTDTVTYTISDGTTTTTGQLTVTTANAAPTAGGFSATVDGGVATTLDVLAHAGDPNADTLTVTGAGPAGHGTITVNASGGVVYTPNPTYAGTDSFSYTVSDGRGGTATGTVTLTVRNQGPQANDDIAMVPVNGSIDVPVLTNDTDANADALTVSLLTPPAHGTATPQADGTVRYVPTAGYLGADTFSYSIDDGKGGTDAATVTVDVANQSPVARADSAVASGNAGSQVTVDVLANDSDPNSDPLSIDSVSVPAHGTATIVSGQIRYTPDATYAGPDSFTYVIGDGRGGLSGATVTVDVQNRDPVANAETRTASTGVARTVDVLANDTDPDAETVTLLSFDATSSQGGTLTRVGGSLRYVSAASFTGTDTFSYVATDPRGGTDVGTVTVQVTNADPVASNRNATTSTDNAVIVDLLAGVTDADGQPVSVVSTGPATHGTVTVDASGRATYTPAPGYAGSDTFTYTVSDGQGGFATETVTLSVADADPVAVDDATSVGYDVPATVDVLANDTDPNIPGTGQILRVTSVNLVSGDATVTIAADGRVTVDPDAGFAGDVVVRYVVSDGAGGSATGQLTVHVAAPLPTAIADSTTTPYGTAVTVDELANDDSGLAGADPTLAHGSVTSPVDSDGDAAGSVTVVGGGLRYVPPTGFAGPVTFDYTVTNPLGGTDAATVSIVVHPRALEERTAKVTIVAGRDSVRIDPGADVTGHGDVTVVSVTQPSRGAKVTVVDGQLVVERLAGFVGTVKFEYVVVGADGTEVTVTVTVDALAAAGSRLPHTGADVGLVSLAGLLLLGLGTAAIRLGRSRDAA